MAKTEKEKSIDQVFDELVIKLANDKDIQKSIDEFLKNCDKYGVLMNGDVKKNAVVEVKFVDAEGKIRAKTLTGIPLLTIVPIPYIPIDSIKVSFKDEDKQDKK